MTSTPLRNQNIVQIGIVVQNVEKAAQAWSLLLGVPCPNIIITDPVESAHTQYQGQTTPAQAKLAFFPLGQITIELIEPLGEPSTWKDQLTIHGQSLHHIAFEIKDMNTCIESLAQLGLPLIQRGDYSGGRYAYLDGSQHHGVIIELLENG